MKIPRLPKIASASVFACLQWVVAQAILASESVKQSSSRINFNSPLNSFSESHCCDYNAIQVINIILFLQCPYLRMRRIDGRARLKSQDDMELLKNTMMS